MHIFNMLQIYGVFIWIDKNLTIFSDYYVSGRWPEGPPGGNPKKISDLGQGCE